MSNKHKDEVCACPMGMYQEAAKGKTLGFNPARALQRGWSTGNSNTQNPAAPRAGVPWTKNEDKDLLIGAAGKINLSVLALTHGRTEHAIACRLETLGVSRDIIVASDFEPVEPHKPVKVSAESRLRTLLSISMGSSEGIAPQDLAFLISDGLIDLEGEETNRGRVGKAILTERGRALIDSLVGRSTARKSVQVERDHARGTSVLNNSKFYLVSSGDVYKHGPHDRPKLKQGPKTIHLTGLDAEKEALRLASENRGQKFFVLQAVSVHEVQPMPAQSVIL